MPDADMESTDATLALSSHTRQPNVIQGSRLHVRVSVRGNELELTDDRVDDKTASVNIQELISAFTGVLKATTNSNRTNAFAGKADESVISTENQEFTVEVVHLRQLVQKLAYEVKHLRQLLQDSKNENEKLKTRFRSATHMKAAELAQRFSTLNIAQNATNGHEPESATGSEELDTPGQEIMELMLDPQIKDIDFLNLDDILGNDDVFDITPKNKAKEFAEEDDSAVMENSIPGSRSIFGDYENDLNETRAETFALPLATAPSVLKIGLNPDIARAGGECKADGSFRSPVRRTPRRRGRFNNNDSSAERPNAVETDEELLVCKDNSMVGTYGIMHKPSTNDESCYKTVLIGNLPQDIDYNKLLVKVRGGDIISATLCDTTKLRGCVAQMSALVVFINSESASAYVQFATKYEICFGSQRALVQLVKTPTYPLSEPAKIRINNGQTRYLVIQKGHNELSLSKIDRTINAGMNRYRADAIDRFWKDENGNVRIRFASIGAAGMAYWRLSMNPNYSREKLKFEPDPCGRPFSDLLPTPTGRRVSDFVNTKVNYDDEDDSDDENTRNVKPVGLPTNTKVNNLDEIDLEDGDDLVDEEPPEGSTCDDEKANENLAANIETATVGEIISVEDGMSIVDFETSTEAKAAQTTAAKEKPAIVDHCRQAQNGKTSAIPNSETATTSDQITKPQSISTPKDSPVARNTSIPDSFTFPLTIPQDSGSVLDVSSNAISLFPSAATGALESWADDVIEAVEAGNLKPPVHLKSILARTALIDFDEERVYPVANSLPTIPEENHLICEPVEEEYINETPMEGPDTDLSIMKLPVVYAATVDHTITATSVKHPVSTPVVTNRSSQPVSNFEMVENLAVKPEKFDLAGTNLVPELLFRYAIDVTLSKKPRKGLAASRWADPNTKPTNPIIVEAPRAVPLLEESEKRASELLFGKVPEVELAPIPQPSSLAPSNALKGPRGGISGHPRANPEISHTSPIQDQLVTRQVESFIRGSDQYTTKSTELAHIPKPNLAGHKFLPCKPYKGIPTSRYAGLGSMPAHPRSSLRGFYTAVDSHGALPQNVTAAVLATTDPQPVPSSLAKSASVTPLLDQGFYSRSEATADPIVEVSECAMAPQIYVAAAATA